MSYCTFNKLKSSSCSFNLLFVVLLLIVTGCGSGDDQQDIFKYNQASGITSLDPAFAKDQANIWATNQIFDGLVALDDSLHIQPAIAKKWEVSQDGKTYTFTLRDDVYFQPHKLFKNKSARKVTAQDFVYSFNRLLSGEVASPGGWVFRGRVDSAEPFKAINDSTLQINLSHSFPPFLGLLTMQYCSVVPKVVVEHYGVDFAKHPVGAGPFKFQHWEKGETLLMADYENYYKTKNGKSLPFLDGIKVTFLQDKQMEFMRFKKGKLHFLSGIDGSYKDELLTKSGKLQDDFQGKIKMLKHPYLNTEYLGFLMKGDSNQAIIPKKVRKAINYGFDRDRMINYLRNNIGIPAHHGFVPPVLIGEQHSVKGYHFDKKKAARLLREAGYPGGEGLSEITLVTNQSYVELGTFIQKQLKELGIEINLNVERPSLLREWMAQGDVKFFRGSWIADYPDPESYLTVFYGNNPAPPNYTRFQNQKFDSLYEKAMLEGSFQKRRDYY